MGVMDEFDAAIHRTIVDYLIRTGEGELAAAVLDGAVESQFWDDDNYYRLVELFIDIPTQASSLIQADDRAKDVLVRAARQVAFGQVHPRHGGVVSDKYRVSFRVKLLPVEEGWQQVVRASLLNPKGANQALVSDIASDGRPLHKWNELRYASASEIRVAQELEKRKVLFFPLAVGVRAETGKNWQDHREVDFLVCENGVWGVLEVAYHPNRYEQDAEKDLWLKKSGILCVQHFTAERCYNTPASVVDEFLAVLAQHRR